MTNKTVFELREMAPPHVERDTVIRHLIKHKLPVKRRESSKISDSEYIYVDVGDEHDEHGDKIGDKLLKVRFSDHRATHHAVRKHGAAHVEIGPHGHNVDRGVREILKHAGIHETANDRQGEIHGWLDPKGNWIRNRNHETHVKRYVRHVYGHKPPTRIRRAATQDIGNEALKKGWTRLVAMKDEPRNEPHGLHGLIHKSEKTKLTPRHHRALKLLKKAIGAEKHIDRIETFNEETLQTRLDTELPPNRKSSSARKYKIKKIANERRPKSPRLSSPKPLQQIINYPMLSNYSLAQRARWGDKQAWEELERRRRQNVPEPQNALEPKTPDAYDPDIHGIDQRPLKGVLKNRIGDKYNEKRKVDVATLKLTPDLYEKNVRLLKDYPNMPKDAHKWDTEKLVEHFIQHAEENLLWLFDQVPESTRQRSKMWYVGANKIANDWAKKYNIPVACVAGALAALSPQTDWYKNVSYAERHLDILKGEKGIYHNFRYSKEMDEAYMRRKAFHKPEFSSIRTLLQGKTLAEIDALPELNSEAKTAAKALWIHLYDGAYHNKQYHLVMPEGDFGDLARKRDGAPTQAGFMTTSSSEKAIIAIESNGNMDIISHAMGDKHKVRNFFNNIYNPHSPDGDVTIDTHAVAAALLRPLSGAAIEVKHNLDTSVDKGEEAAGRSAATGVGGTYAFYAEAYRRAAKKRGVEPREMQSITWEAIRGLYDPSFKRHHSQKAEELWAQYREGMIDIKTLRKKILTIVGGKINEPSWLTGSADVDAEEEDISEGRIDEGAGDSHDAAGISRSGIRWKSPSATDLGTRIGTATTIQESRETRRKLIIAAIKRD
jgi:hypothetical protein